MNVRTFAAIAGILATATAVTAGAEKPKVPFRTFSALEVENFQNPKYQTKAPMPDDWLPLIREDITQRVIATHRFQRVMDFEDPKVTKPDTERVLVLRGTVVEFTHGSQAARFLVGMGAGAGKIVVNCEFVDKATGDVVFTRKVDGKVIGTGQSTEGAIKGISKEIAGVINSSW
jgi:Domain of unknown function (DUF4410)